MANTNAMDFLKKEGSVQVYPGMIVVYPFNQRRGLNLSDMAPKFNGCYATNNSTVCFIAENKIWVTPITRDVIRCLLEAGFTKEYFYVPFSNGDYPLTEKFKWELLVSKARASHAKEFHEDCAKYCDEHNIGSINLITLENCFKMPHSGVSVKHLYFQTTYFPIAHDCFDCTVADSIGKFCTNNGRVVFVYRDGNTYVTKGYKILNELRSAGYTQGALFVPFSNGETLLDSSQRAKWESIRKN